MPAIDFCGSEYLSLHDLEIIFEHLREHGQLYIRNLRPKNSLLQLGATLADVATREKKP